MALKHFRMLIYEFLNKDQYIVPEEAPLVILDSKSAVCMSNTDKNTKNIRKTSRKVNFVINGEK